MWIFENIFNICKILCSMPYLNYKYCPICQTLYHPKFFTQLHESAEQTVWRRASQPASYIGRQALRRPYSVPVGPLSLSRSPHPSYVYPATVHKLAVAAAVAVAIAVAVCSYNDEQQNFCSATHTMKALPESDTHVRGLCA